MTLYVDRIIWVGSAPSDMLNHFLLDEVFFSGGGVSEVTPSMGYIGMYGCKGYGFWAVSV